MGQSCLAVVHIYASTQLVLFIVLYCFLLYCVFSNYFVSVSSRLVLECWNPKWPANHSCESPCVLFPRLWFRPSSTE